MPPRKAPESAPDPETPDPTPDQVEDETVPLDAPEGESPAANVHEAITRIIRDTRAIGKDFSTTGAGSYRYRGIEAVKAVLKPLLARHGVHYAPTGFPAGVDKETYQTSGGGTWNRRTGVIEFTFWGPNETEFKAYGYGEGADSSDKSSNKMLTTAEKQVLIQVFCVADAEGDPDNERAAEQHGSTAAPPRTPGGRGRPAAPTDTVTVHQIKSKIIADATPVIGGDKTVARELGAQCWPHVIAGFPEIEDHDDTVVPLVKADLISAAAVVAILAEFNRATHPDPESHPEVEASPGAP